jgi:hypothetical protein
MIMIRIRSRIGIGIRNAAETGIGKLAASPTGEVEKGSDCQGGGFLE